MIHQINDRFKFYLIIYENVNFIMASEQQLSSSLFVRCCALSIFHFVFNYFVLHYHFYSINLFFYIEILDVIHNSIHTSKIIFLHDFYIYVLYIKSLMAGTGLLNSEQVRAFHTIAFSVIMKKKLIVKKTGSRSIYFM